MPVDDETELEAIARFWDQLVQGRPEEQRRVDPADAAVIRRLHALDARPAPSSVFVQRLREDLMRTPTISPNNVAASPLVAPLTPWRRLVHGSDRAPRAAAGSRRALRLAAAAMLLVLLAGSLLLRGGVRGDAPRSAAIRAAVAESSVETLMDVTLPAGAIAPPADQGWWGWWRYTISPGAAVRYYDAAGGPNVEISYVLAGAYTVQAKGALTVIRAARNGAASVRETVRAGETTTLQTGDAFVYQNTTHDDFTGFRNASSAPLEVVSWDWETRVGHDAGGPGGVDNIVWDSWGGTADAPPTLPVDTARPVRVLLRRFMIASGATIPETGPDNGGLLPPGSAGFELGAVEQGNVTVSYASLAGPATPNPVQKTHFGSVRKTPAGGWIVGESGLPTTMTREVVSTGSGPASVLDITITNESSAVATPTP